jgi:hypothetical protein
MIDVLYEPHDPINRIDASFVGVRSASQKLKIFTVWLWRLAADAHFATPRFVARSEVRGLMPYIETKRPPSSCHRDIIVHHIGETVTAWWNVIIDDLVRSFGSTMRERLRLVTLSLVS